MDHIVVIGGGQAGAAVTAKLRALGYDGQITLICDEPVPPYQRPPLSKAYLLGEMAQERLYLRPEQFYRDQNITLRLGQAVSRIDRAAKTVQLGTEEISYDQLVLTTGSFAWRLPDAMGGSLEGVYLVRSLADVDSMAPEFQPDRRLLIVGGGYIGLEAAAVAVKRGLKVTLVERAGRILQRVAAPQTSDYFRKLHRDHGLDLRENMELEKLLGDTRVNGALFCDSTTIDADFVIAGCGVVPGHSLAQDAGIETENGIATNAFGQTNDPDIWAAGDCASFPSKGGRLRLESVQNAIDQAECVAANILGAEQHYRPKPWFWSDQYDVKLQIAGLNTDYDNVAIRCGEQADSVSHWYYKGRDLLAVDAMNAPRDYMIGKRLIEAGKSPMPSLISDPETDLKGLLK